jgi:tetratricopeptide (TPR) repeat protein
MRARSHVLGGLALTMTVLCTVAPPALAGIGDGPDKAASAPHSLLGSYLAGRVARGLNDTRAAASYYTEALSRDPGNDLLMEQSFIMEATEARWPDAERLARNLVKAQPAHRLAHAFLGLVDFKAGRYDASIENFKLASANPIGELTSTLARAWVHQAQGKTQEALSLLDAPKQPDWAQYYLRYHRALIADVADRPVEARAAYERIPKNDLRTLRVVLAYAAHAANAGDTKLAQGILKGYFDRSKGDGHPYALALQKEIDSGSKPPLLITTANDGLAEVFYDLGEALSGEGGVSVGIIYLQFSLYLAPEQPFALAALANVYETTKRYEAAIAVYDRMPKGTPFALSVDIRKALNLNQLERVDESQRLLEDLAKRNPDDIRPLDALGGLMRNHKRWAEAVDYYSRAIALIGKPQAKHWTYYYARGTAYERLKKWPAAEADLKVALKLSSEEPAVLNYLGYSWIDQKRNLKQGLAMIEKAVRRKPDDGYIVDSLGWAYYRLGRYKDAVKHLERAVELRPEDPTLNDHLGDVYWHVGRQREARFQWEQALTLNPEPEDAEKIRHKLEKGLPGTPQARQHKHTREVHRREPPKKRTEISPAPKPFFQ